jgi:hypothetical protein
MCDHGCGGSGQSQVALYKNCLAASSDDLRNYCLALRSIAAGDRDFGAFPREKDGAGPTNPGISARNERDLGVEHSLHRHFSCRAIGSVVKVVEKAEKRQDPAS